MLFQSVFPENKDVYLSIILGEHNEVKKKKNLSSRGIWLSNNKILKNIFKSNVFFSNLHSTHEAWLHFCPHPQSSSDMKHHDRAMNDVVCKCKKLKISV